MILRTYCCSECNHMLTVELSAAQWDQPPPSCPMCARETHQEFFPPAIGGSNVSKAVATALDIAERDYGVADLQTQGRDNGPPKVRFKDQGEGTSTWGAHSEALQQAVALGQQTRQQHGSALDISRQGPDLIALSKRRSARVW